MSDKVMGCSPEMMREHSEAIAKLQANQVSPREVGEIKALAKSNQHRIKENEEILKEMRSMNTNVGIIARSVESMAKEQQEQREDIEKLQESQATVDTVRRVYEEMDNRDEKFSILIEKMDKRMEQQREQIQTLENKDDKEAAARLKSLNNRITGLAIAIVTAVAIALVKGWLGL